MLGKIAWRLVALSTVLALCGCVVIPVPGPPDARQRNNIDEHAGDAFRAGIHTREDVLLALGEPADFADDGRWLQYTDVRNLGHWLIAGCGGYVCNGFETADKYRYRTIVFYFDRGERLRELLNLDSPAGFVPDVRLLEQHVQAVAEPGEGVVEPFFGVARRVADRWAFGAMVVTDRALLYFETPDTGPLYRLALRLPAASIEWVGWARDGDALAGDAFVRVQRVDGTTEAFALQALSGQTTTADTAFDRVRAAHFIDIAGWLRPRMNR